MALDRSRRLCFCLQFGASLTFASFSRRRIADRVRRATTAWSHQPRVIYGSYDRRVHRRAPSVLSRDVADVAVHRIKSLGTRSVQKVKEVTTALQEKVSRKISERVREKVTCFSFCVAFIEFLFLNANVMIAAYAGGGLATAARLWWDPTTYVGGRELDQRYYELTKYGFTLATGGLLLLTVLAALALLARNRRRQMLLLLYILVMGATVTTEAVLLYYAYEQYKPRFDEGREQLKELVANIKEVLDLIAQYHDFMEDFRPFLEELERDVPIRLETMAKISVGLGILQVAAVLLALVAVCQARPARRQ